ncbi:MAG TPA: hypothetical protein ENI23_13185 [bacterium]|nr:hypothetical protein [bacterium]
MVDKKLEDIFDDEVMEIIFNCAKGIPRNTISACSLLVDNTNGERVTKTRAEIILKERFTDRIINDRVDDLELKRIYKQMMDILKHHFNGTAKSQEDYVKKVKEMTGIGRNSILLRINDLTKFGIFVQYRGGYNRVNKIISFS